MMRTSKPESQILSVSNFQALVSTPFDGAVNAMCWNRKLKGDFQEIVEKIEFNENIATLDRGQLQALELSEQGQLARETLLHDFKLLKDHGASPTLNLIKSYERDDSFFPTDVYSFHVDRSPVPTSTFLCTYYGAASEIVSNAQAEQKVLVPEIREELKELYGGAEEGFGAFLKAYFFDLHYRTIPEASITNLGVGHLWRLAVDHPDSKVMPCVHRAPIEKAGQTRLLMIC